MTRRRLTRLATLGLSAVALLTLSACAGGPVAADSSVSESSSCVDVGAEACVEVSGPIKLAYFSGGLASTWGAANAEAVEAHAAESGIDLTIFDGGFDATQQFQQIQQALSSGQYNAIAVVANDSDLICQALSESAPAEGVLVAAINMPLCGAGANSDTSQYAPPGTLSYIGLLNTEAGIRAWFDKTAEQVTGPQKVVLVTGPETDVLSRTISTVVDEFESDHPDWEFVGVNRTDYSTAEGFSATQDLLNAHPDATLVMSAFADITVGAVNAIEQSGLAGKIAVTETGGNGQTIALVCDGAVSLTFAETPATNGTAALDAILGAFAGDSVPRFIDTNQPQLDPTSACDYTAEF